MKKTTMVLLLCSIALLIVPSLGAQVAGSSANSGVLGYLDPHTGAFRPVTLATEESVDAASLPVFGGTITVTLTITLKTTAITNVTCSANVSVTDAATTGTPRFLTETETVAATGTGTTRTCKITIPYSWGLATQSTDSMSTGYVVSGSPATAGALPVRTSTVSPLDTRKVPANGTITALSAAVTL
jgi:hypothetical protein